MANKSYTWEGKGIVTIGGKSYGGGEKIPATKLDSDRLDYFIKEKLVVEKTEKKEFKPVKKAEVKND